MWKCPKCETINNSPNCNVCGEPMPENTQAQPLNQTENPYLLTMYPPIVPVKPPIPEPKKSHKGLIIGIVAGIVFLIAGIILGFLIFTDNSQENTTQSAPQQITKENTSNNASIPDTSPYPDISDNSSETENTIESTAQEELSVSDITLNTLYLLLGDGELSEEELKDTFGDGPYNDGFVFFKDKTFHNIETASAYFGWSNNSGGSAFSILDFTKDKAGEVEKLLEESCTLKFPKKSDSPYTFYTYENLTISASKDYTSVHIRK